MIFTTHNFLLIAQSKNTEYDQIRNWCQECPTDSTGIYPNCLCQEGGAFLDGYCATCPYNSHGNYGECLCEGNATYIEQDNRCVACPTGR